ncbi:MAG TPA: hybrid sensor histidine kinase/response regulator [Lacunisphaera sp.]|nr:hybrid sensor histidine kinase/response regulator [Lacunisphaera sp.]
MTTRTTGNLAGHKILVVDDDRLNIRILTGILQQEGGEVASADSGEAALTAYDEFHPDLVLLDVVMPGIDGFETCRTLKRRHGDACAPVIFITARSDSADVIEGLGAGGVDYLPKPFRPQETLARIRTHLYNRLLLLQLSKANAAKNKLLSMVAHDLRNPLASIRGLAAFLRDGAVGELTAEQRDLAGTIHEASQSMLQLVNEILDVSVIESGELKLRFEPCVLASLVEKSVHLNNINAAQKGTSITLTANAPLRTVQIDAPKIKQVVDNLLSNAVKFSPPGALIRVEVTAGDADCSVAVRDQGPGIPEEERHKLFQDFGRTSVRPTGGEHSTGLGLAICRKIVEAHQGTITAENLPGGGCEFKFTLPAPP